MIALPEIRNPKSKIQNWSEYWNQYVATGLLPRLHAFELMMAPYAIAHMKVGLKLAETGYQFAADERARIYLTNALEPKVSQLPQLGFDALAREAQEVNEIKWYKRFTVVIGNPPYAGHSSNESRDVQSALTYIGRLVEDYRLVDGKPLVERQSKWLQDDYVKFIRLAQKSLVDSKVGVLGLITNHSFIDNPTFRGMRQNLTQQFSKISILDLYGNLKKKEVCPDGLEGRKIYFDIQQEVCRRRLA